VGFAVVVVGVAWEVEGGVGAREEWKMYIQD